VVNKSENMLIRFDATYKRDGQTNGHRTWLNLRTGTYYTSSWPEHEQPEHEQLAGTIYSPPAA